nr:hypothetical protein Iba_chr04cCG0380 [Ipomoea batatas]
MNEVLEEIYSYKQVVYDEIQQVHWEEENFMALKACIILVEIVKASPVRVLLDPDSCAAILISSCCCSVLNWNFGFSITGMVLLCNLNEERVAEATVRDGLIGLEWVMQMRRCEEGSSPATAIGFLLHFAVPPYSSLAHVGREGKNRRTSTAVLRSIVLTVAACGYIFRDGEGCLLPGEVTS